ncbi:MAG TPA: 16S rRNA (guanine(527)-N(7))-methyltransferase RsmG [Firmicutes bacterium]|nr:16S rRNA (guanine(527)-N(7))-methyltransferase RsmG [Bacillota bacterium]
MTYEEMAALLKEKGILLTEECLQKLDEYLHLLIEWNERFNLTSIKTEGEIIEKHFYDCLLASDPSLLKEGKKVADLGSGAGFPGLVWAICFPKASYTLIEATKKKCTFLEEVARVLGLTNVTVLNGRVEELPSTYKESFDVVTARAVAELPIFAELALPFLKVNGTFVAMKGAHGEHELKNAEHACKVLGVSKISISLSSLPNDEGERCNIYLLKGKKTDKRYPRKYSDILKKPL